MTIQCAAGVILHDRGHFHHWEGRQGLSIKTFTGGKALYDVGQGRYAVDDASYLILNQQQSYTITIASPTMIESFCVFFAPNFAEEVQRSNTASDLALLDAPDADGNALHFFERTYPHDDIVSPILRNVRFAIKQGRAESGWLNEQLHGLMRRLLDAHRLVHAEVRQLAAVRATTREEIYRRLHQARDYAASMFATPITLHEMARIACMSPNHFLRTFRQAFGQTPHQFVTAKRLALARHLLTHTEQSITAICMDVGFTSLGSFSWLFRQQVGMSPEAFRRQKGDFQEVPVADLWHNISGVHQI